MRSRSQPAIPAQLIHQIDGALAAVDTARTQLAGAIAEDAPVRDLRTAHARVRHAFDEADEFLRRATGLAREHSHREWSLWRHRLSSLDAARQIHLLAEQDCIGVLPIGSRRAIDTGMSGPDIGELQHGQSRAPGTPPAYGLDLEALMAGAPEPVVAAAGPGHAPVLEATNRVSAVEKPLDDVGSPPEAAA